MRGQRKALITQRDEAYRKALAGDEEGDEAKEEKRKKSSKPPVPRSQSRGPRKQSEQQRPVTAGRRGSASPANQRPDKRSPRANTARRSPSHCSILCTPAHNPAQLALTIGLSRLPPSTLCSPTASLTPVLSQGGAQAAGLVPIWGHGRHRRQPSHPRLAQGTESV